MKKIFLPTSVVCLLTFILALTSFKAKSNNAGNTATASSKSVETASEKNTSVEAVSNLLYDSLNLEELGLSREVMNLAYKGQQQLSNQDILNNENVMAIVDFSQPSNKKRIYIIDVKNYRVLFNTYVAHGKNSGLTRAESFSNTHESLQSSLGFYVTRKTYFGKHGLSLKLSGLERGFNDNAESRAVVMHGANYIGSNRLGSSYMGRSFGCPAVPQAQSNKVINLLKNGTCLFVYHPTKKYLNNSKILNG